MDSTIFLITTLLLAIAILPLCILFVISLGTLPDIVENDLRKYKGLKGFIKHYFIVEKSDKIIYKIFDGLLSIASISYMLFIYFLNKMSLIMLIVLATPFLVILGLFITLFEKKEKQPKYSF